MINTDGYLVLGLIVIVSILTLYTSSLWLRVSNTRKTIQLLENLKSEQH